MKNLLKSVFGRIKVNNRGFSLVEVLCAVAIFSLVSGTVGTVVVVASHTYRNGVSETTVQQEAQLAANNIGDIIKDACKIVYYDNDSGKVMEDGNVKVDESGSEVAYSGYNTLDIVTNDNVTHRITYNWDNHKLYYIEPSSDGSTVTQELAGNITSFSVVTDGFDTSRSVTVNMSVDDTSTGRSIPLSYKMTSRNDVAGEVAYTRNSDDPVIIFLEDLICLVPGEDEGTSYRIPLSVTGTYTELKARYTPEGGTDPDGKLKVGEVTSSYVEVYVPKSVSNEVEAVYDLEVYTSDTKTENGVLKPLASATAKVYVRTVKSVTTKYTVNVASATNNDREAAGAEYTFSATVGGNNLSKFVGRTFDLNYKIAQSVYWSYELTADGNTYTYASTADGEVYSNKTGAENYIEIITANSKTVEDSQFPKLTIKLKKDMPSDFSLKVTATSKHGLGVNKGAVYEYNEAKGKDVNTGNTAYATVSGDVTVTKVNDDYEFIMEPNETETFSLDSIISSVGDYEISYHTEVGAVSSEYTPAAGTSAVFDPEAKTITVKIGKNEKGNGETEGNEPYTFFIDIISKGATGSGSAYIAKIKIHVRRIDYLHIKLEGVKESDNYDNGVAYHFKVRYNSTNDGQNDAIIKYLISSTNKDENKQKEEIQNALAVELSWTIKDMTDTTDDVLDSDLSKNGQKKVLKAEVDYVNVGNVSAKDWNLAKKTEIDNAQPDTKIKTEKFTVDTDGYKYEATVKYPLVRVYKNSSGTILGYSMIQPAEIDIKLKEKDTKNSSEKLTASCKHSAVASPDFSEIKSFSGLSSGKKLVVKAVAKHPYAAYNRGNEDYVVNEDDITDIYVLSGEAGTVTVDETPVLSDFKRGDDYIFTGSWDWGSLRTVYSGTEGALFRYYRTDIGSSSANYYYKALESGSTIKINAAETLALLPQYEYILEFIPIFKDDNSLTYPINSSLAAAIGLSEGWASGTTQMDFSEYGKRYKIPAATMTLSIENDESNPYVFNGISEANIRFDLSNIEVGHFSDSYYKMYLERKDGDNWVSCTTTPARTYGNIEVKRNGSDMSIYLSQNNVIANGLYRARIVIDKAAFKEITGTTFDYTTQSSSEDTVYDRYIYIKINKQ